MHCNVMQCNAEDVDLTDVTDVLSQLGKRDIVSMQVT